MIELIPIGFSVADVIPARDAVLENQGVPAGRALSEAVTALCSQALAVLSEVATPAGLLAEISVREFAEVYRGEGDNDASTPVADIFARADSLALFAVTLGDGPSREIAKCFGSNDPALGAMLDSAASAAADKLAEVSQARFADALAQAGRATPVTRVLRYSPGYCGWHLSGQRRLFEFLRPERIGISLNSSFLMQPLKSVSGVMIAGRREIHCFEASYPCCRHCRTPSCRERIRALPPE